jgi:flagellar hook protein FlgE
MSMTVTSSALAAGLDGMRAAQTKLDSHAHRIANAQTAAETPASPSIDGLAEDLVGERMSLYHFAANLRTVQTQDHLLGTLLDIRA